MLRRKGFSKLNFLLIVGFLLVLMLMGGMLNVGLNKAESTASQVDTLVNVHQRKLALLAQMLRAARERSLILLKTLVEDDVFAIEDALLDMSAQVNIFSPAFTELLSMDLTEREREVADNLNTLTARVVPMQSEAINLMRAEEFEAARQLMLEEGLPGQDDLLGYVAELQQVASSESSRLLTEIHESIQDATKSLIVLGGIALFLGGVVLAYLMIMVSRGERLLRSRSDAILNSIREAVITIDHDAIIEYVNPHALDIMGRTKNETIGKALDKVYCINDETTNECIPFSKEKGVKTGRGDSIVLKDSTGNKIPIEESIVEIDNLVGKKGTAIVFRDISERRSMTERLTYQAYHDVLTGLPNRLAFERQAGLMIDDVIINDETCCMIYFDLDQFKVVNDTAGHAAGDELLIQLSSRLKKLLRSNDILSRLGGDEFGVLLSKCNREDAKRMAEKILKDVREFLFIYEQRQYQVGASIGICMIDANTRDINQVMSEADIACYSAKKAGRNCIRVYDYESEEISEEHRVMNWSSRIKQALQEDKFILFGQKIANYSYIDNRNRSFEILVRLREDDEIITPGVFMPSAERFGLMVELDRWVIENSFSILASHPGQSCNINLSGDSFKDDGLLSFIKTRFNKYALDPSRVTFEITETVAMGNLSAAREVVSELKDIGVSIALDDFGTGLSSFAYLKHFPVDTIKIDKSFVDDILTDPFDREFISSIVAIARALNIKTVAEGVESIATLASLKELNVDAIQGYALHRPEPLTSLLANSHSTETKVS